MNLHEAINSESYFPGGGKLPTTEAAKKKAKIEDSQIVYPKDNELFIDIDSQENYKTYVAQREVAAQYFKILKVVEVPSKTKDHWHITITLDLTLTAIHRILLQALLGSDLKRELLGFLMALNGEQQPTLFLEKKSK